MIHLGKTIRRRTETGYIQVGKVDYIHPSGKWYKVTFTMSNGNSYSECFFIKELHDGDWTKEEQEEIKRQQQARREFYQFWHIHI